MADLEFEEINRGNQPTQDGAGTDDAWTFTGKITRNFNKIKAFFADSSNAASRKVGADSGNVMQVGAFGLGRRISEDGAIWDESDKRSGFFRLPAHSADNPFGATSSAAISWSGHAGASAQQPCMDRLVKTWAGVSYYFQHFDGTEWGALREILHTGNTTVDGNGFIKEASPIIKLFGDKLEKTNHLEIENAEFEKLGIGHYKIKNVPELSRDGWYIETPKDRNNNIYFTLDYEELDGELIIKTYEPDYSSGKAENGAPIDILEGRFVSLRFAEDPSLYPDPDPENEDEIGEE